MTEEVPIAIVEPKPEKVPVKIEDGMIVTGTLAEQYRFAQYVVASHLVPVDTPEKAMIVMQRGAELGFKGMVAFDFLYVVNNKVRLTPQGAKAKAQESGLIEDAREDVHGEGPDMEAVVTVKRKGIPTATVSRFSIKDAQRARLIDSSKPGAAWNSYPKRMLLARARGFAYQDAFADLCGGLQVRETFDLEPGEALAGSTARPAQPKTGADPLLAKLGVKIHPTTEVAEAEFVSHAEAEVRAPFPSHTEADRAIVEQEKGRKGRRDR